MLLVHPQNRGKALLHDQDEVLPRQKIVWDLLPDLCACREQGEWCWVVSGSDAGGFGTVQRFQFFKSSQILFESEAHTSKNKDFVRAVHLRRKRERVWVRESKVLRGLALLVDA